MPCCGGKRTRMAQMAQNAPASLAVQPGRPVRPAVSPVVTFEYAGKTALSVVGPVSGLRYRFAYSGAKMQVDARDRRGLLTVPLLRLVG